MYCLDYAYYGQEKRSEFLNLQGRKGNIALRTLARTATCGLALFTFASDNPEESSFRDFLFSPHYPTVSTRMSLLPSPTSMNTQ